ncbi:MAG: hypothetical protein B7Y39_09060 [Bdellovibrio sp. 28-41-41]|nr:MAG: hypothetical protein B7Y39_09060 [Bdellovibrio sp. 28-41-41]
MNAALYTRPWFQAKPIPSALAANRLSRIKVKDYSLIGFRDLEAENETLTHLEFLKTQFKFSLPKLYTLVSQNRKISIKETLSGPQRLFLNFESFKWSELFFNFFRQIVGPSTEHFVFQHLLYSLDIYICQFQLLSTAITLATKNSSNYVNSALQRHKNQFELMSMIQNHQHGEKLFLVFIFELLLISLGKNHYTSCATFVTKAESHVLLNYFSSQGLISVESDKLFYSEEKLQKGLKKYFEFRGQILFTEHTKNIFSESLFLQFKNIFEEKESVLEHKAFETCFTHA